MSPPQLPAASWAALDPASTAERLVQSYAIKKHGAGGPGAVAELTDRLKGGVLLLLAATYQLGGRYLEALPEAHRQGASRARWLCGSDVMRML